MSTNRSTTASMGYGINLLLLLVLLMLALIVAPLFERRSFGGIVLYGLLSALLLAGGGLTSNRRGLFTGAILLIGVTLPISWISVFSSSRTLFVASCFLDGIFCLYLAAILLRNVLRRYLATWQSVFGSLAAYLLIGLAWAMMYWATECIEMEQITFSETPKVRLGSSDLEVTAFSQMVYFSFVTMSTLGYGDVTPKTPFVRSLAWTQAVVGQFYIAVIVARLVAEIGFSEIEKARRIGSSQAGGEGATGDGATGDGPAGD